jgi:hypothetical protein
MAGLRVRVSAIVAGRRIQGQLNLAKSDSENLN